MTFVQRNPKDPSVGDRYTLEEINFKTPSEHKFSGQARDIEV